MTIRNKESFHGKLVIDLTGPEGNAFVLLGHAKNLAYQLGLDGEDIKKRMVSGSYDNLVEVFDKEFGEYVDLLR